MVDTIHIKPTADPSSCVRPQDIYKFVTHEKGILGSQGEYNRRHRKLCQPPFRSPQLLQDFASIVVHRCIRLSGSCSPKGNVVHVSDSLLFQNLKTC